MANYDRGISLASEPYKTWLKVAKKAGWTVVRTKRSHLKLTSPTGKVIIMENPSNSQRRTRYSIRNRLIEEGLDIE